MIFQILSTYSSACA